MSARRTILVGLLLAVAVGCGRYGPPQPLTPTPPARPQAPSTEEAPQAEAPPEPGQEGDARE